ncbi:MAG: hypothetical protein H7234_07115 [Herminiimonas sp.]|nr:hypothetical protein [Herminiimonas sp.]
MAIISASGRKHSLRHTSIIAAVTLLLSACWGGQVKAPAGTVSPDAGNGAPGTVQTVAGTGAAGAVNGAHDVARFSSPQGVAVDHSGTIYVADSINNLIRKISTSGVVTTLAGSGISGIADGTGTAASFSNPLALAVDAQGVVYVCDAGNNAIRRIDTAGVVTTLAGGGSAGFADAQGGAARFNSPRGVAVSSRGDVYVADFANHRIRKVTPLGVVTTFAGNDHAGAGNGTSAAASFNDPAGIAIDGKDDLYVGDQGNQLIRKISSAGNVTTLAGSGTAGMLNGSGTAASFNMPGALAVDGQGTVYVIASAANLVRQITAAGVVSAFAGSGLSGSKNGPASEASFNLPGGIAIDAGGNVVLADTANHAIRRIIKSR